jgi:hypothetical protein
MSKICIMHPIRIDKKVINAPVEAKSLCEREVKHSLSKRLMVDCRRYGDE